MTCKEFSSYNSTQSPTGQMGSEAAMHLETCASCRRAWYASHELSRRLEEIKERVPAVPSTVDFAVLAAYRDQVKGGSEGHSRTSSLFRAMAWSGIAAALIVAILIFAPLRSVPKIGEVSWNPPAIVVPPIAKRTQHKFIATTATGTSRRPAVKKGNRSMQTASTVAAAESTGGFESLMYCDALSCAGTMDVIRLEIPVQPMRGIRSLQLQNGFVQADVVVGSDGIARAIRIVK